ncbi:threonine ammonia-lyase IlvA [Nocardioides seonyuensis]|uniref:L-threonine dehydratase n=1 Tax=Nocardioides seonyuensis TaxID=2518371 RepID=A0A4P7ILK3_9ACTN|nr:threonine ammonia-lyase IlvA [Nocardioides seonyuensis]
MTAADVDDAAARLVGVVETTPLHRNQRLSAAYGCEVLLKREDLQQVRSYKVRGAHNLILQLDDEARSRGVVCASAGNHAQGFAVACASLGVDGTVFVPATTPRQKRERIAVLGGDRVVVRIVGDTYDDASEAAVRHAADTGATLVHAFDDPRTVAGQGTVVAEAFAQLGRAPDVVVVPVGGGGLLAGVVAWLAGHHPQVEVVAVEPGGAASLAAALAAGGPVDLPEVDTFVDGAAVRRAGRTPYDVIAGAVPGSPPLTVVSVPEGRVCQEMLALYQSDGIIAEPAGALPTAALGHAWTPEPGAEVLCILSGGNNDVSRYADVLERALLWEGRKHYFLVEFPQEPGALRRFLDDVLGPDDDITLFEYVKRSNREVGPALVGIELGDPADLPALLARMEAAPPKIERVPPDSPLFTFLV